MKLENQVVSLELSKKLKDLGFEQESLFYWDYRNKVGEELKDTIIDKKQIENYDCAYSAYTVAELGEMLPHEISDKDLEVCKIGEGLWSTGYPVAFPIALNYEKDKTMANSMAKMLIYLKENNILK